MIEEIFSRDLKTRNCSVKIGPWAAFGPSPLSGAFYGAPGVPGCCPEPYDGPQVRMRSSGNSAASPSRLPAGTIYFSQALTLLSLSRPPALVAFPFLPQLAPFVLLLRRATRHDISLVPRENFESSLCSSEVGIDYKGEHGHPEGGRLVPRALNLSLERVATGWVGGPHS